ncbi:MAG: hypothetical protein BWX81_00585 [Spirochaetes bacterium ADurb.Bin110]|nr:MAG: hypothetical protein BWX81_00585 [Spirochaetes bacterium ADurb.Bin110]HNV35992.1 hypothetical protein [Rectinema sp.]
MNKDCTDGWIRRAIAKLKAYRLDLYLDDCFEQAESLNALIAEGEQILQEAALARNGYIVKAR